ncbi:MAG TPA: response regulator [Polyangiaceae bacterium]
MLERIQRALTDAGYEVTTTSQVVGNARYLASCDLLIIDYHMPGLNGDSVVESLRTMLHTTKHKSQLFVYTSDDKVAANHRELGFDGAFWGKGDESVLVRQVAALFRTLEMRAAMSGKGEG